MASYLLDTNHLSPLVTINHPLRKRILAAASDADRFYILPIVVAEMVFGIGQLPRAEANLSEWQRIKPTFDFVNITAEDAELSASLRILLKRRGKQLELVDALIATIALRLELVLLTTDGDFQYVPRLKRENWLA